MLCRRKMESQRGWKKKPATWDCYHPRARWIWKSTLICIICFLDTRKGCLLCCCCFSCWDFAPFEIRMFFEIMLIHRQYGLENVCKVLLNGIISYANMQTDIANHACVCFIELTKEGWNPQNSDLNNLQFKRFKWVHDTKVDARH